MKNKKYLFEILKVLYGILLFCSCSKTITEPEPKFLKLHFYYGFGNQLNTFEQAYTKDLVQDGYITVDFWLTEAEQKCIRNKLNAIDFFHFPDTLVCETKIMVAITDPGWQFLRVVDENRDKIVYWRYPLPSGNKYSTHLIELINLLIEIIDSKPEYKALPPARGIRW